MALVIERFSKGAWAAPWARHGHTARYEWASSFTKGATVVDAACGTGYGSKCMLDNGAERVHGFDISEEAVREARESHPGERLSFEVADVTRLPLPDDFCDVFVSMETIEHLADERPFLAEVRRVLKRDGVFICSTPNRKVSNPGTTIEMAPYNRYHVREYDVEEFRAILAAYFGSVQFFGQSLFGASYIGMLNVIGRVVPTLAVRIHQTRRVLAIPWEGIEKHVPTQIPIRAEPAVLIAVCRAGADAGQPAVR